MTTHTTFTFPNITPPPADATELYQSTHACFVAMQLFQRALSSAAFTYTGDRAALRAEVEALEEQLDQHFQNDRRQEVGLMRDLSRWFGGALHAADHSDEVDGSGEAWEGSFGSGDYTHEDEDSADE